MAEAHAEAHRGGWVTHGATRWTDFFKFNTDHKVIGIQYITVSLFFFVLAGLLAEVIRMQLFSPGNSIATGSTFNQLFSMHGTWMIFLFIVPIMVGVGNYVVPLQIGANDMAFPKLNALSFWLSVVGGVLMLYAYIAGGTEAGWSAYPPFSETTGSGQTWWAVSLIILGFSSIFAAVNFLTTIFTMRAPGMTMMRLPLLSWSVIATALMILFGTPVLAASLALLTWDRVAGTHFFTASGDPLMWQNLFWFYSHPAVYIMILPGFGVISEVLPVFSRKPIFGYKMIAFSSMAIALFGFLVWAHHMFTSGMNPLLRIPFMITSMIIAVPTGIKIFSWLGTIWGGRIRFTTSMMFALGFIANFVLGGLSGIFLASIPIDLNVQDSYFVVAHFHYVLFGGSVMTIFAGLYFYYPKITGRMLNERLGKLHFWLTFIGFNLTFLPQHWLGLMGMPRRVFTYSPELTLGNRISTIGAITLGIAAVPFLINALVSLRVGKVAGPNPWRALTLEWTLSSPPPIHNFPEPPIVTGDPYGYGRKESQPEPARPGKPAARPAPAGGGGE